VSARRRLLGWMHRSPGAGTATLLAPGTLWLTVFFVVPLLLMLGASVMHRGTYGGVEPGFTLEHYRRFVDPLYLQVLWRTVWWAGLTTVICLVVGFPLAWVIARSRYRNLLLFLVVLPCWTSFLVRTFAIIFLLRDTGLVNSILLRIGVISEPLVLLYTPFAVLLGLVYGFLPFMVLPIFASLERLDPALLEAAETLGARPHAQFFRVTLPLALPGVIAGCILVFVPALGSFVTSDLLGGAKQVMIGNLVQNQFTSARNWPFGSAVSFVLVGVVGLAVVLSLRLRDRGHSGASG
jgi:spermidine/putrescine transport system permease protein